MDQFVSEDDMLDMLLESRLDFLSALPRELLEGILVRLEPLEIIKNVFPVSRKFFLLSGSSILWRILFEKEFEVEPLSSSSIASSLPLTLREPVSIPLNDSQPRSQEEALRVNEFIDWRIEFRNRFAFHRRFVEQKLKLYSTSDGGFALVAVNGKYVAANDSSDALTMDLVQIWDLDKAKNKAISTGQENYPTCLKMTQPHIAVGTSSGEVKVFHLSTKNLSFTLPPPDQSVSAHVTALDMIGHRFIAVGYSTGQVSFWELGAATIPIRSGGHNRPVEVLLIDEERNAVVSVSNGDIVVWEISTGKVKGRTSTKESSLGSTGGRLHRMVSYCQTSIGEASFLFREYKLMENGSMPYFQCYVLDCESGASKVRGQTCDFLDPPFGCKIYCWDKYLISWCTEYLPIGEVRYYLDLATVTNELIWRNVDPVSLDSKLRQLIVDKTGEGVFIKVYQDCIFAMLGGYLVGVWTLKKGTSLLQQPILLVKNQSYFREFFPFENGIVVHSTNRIEFFEWEKQHYTTSKASGDLPPLKAALPFRFNELPESTGAADLVARMNAEASVDLFSEASSEDEEPPRKKQRLGNV